MDQQSLKYREEFKRICDNPSTGRQSNYRPDVGMPKLEPREKQDSGIVSLTVQDESDEDTQVNGGELIPHLPLSFPTDSPHLDYRQIIDRVLFRDEDESRHIGSSGQDQEGVSDTQEPGANTTANPMVAAMGGSAGPQYPSIKKAAEGLMETRSAIHDKDSVIASLIKEKDDLQSELAQSEMEMAVKIRELGQEKEWTEYQLKGKRVEFETVIHKCDTEISSLKEELQQKDEEVKKYTKEMEQEMEKVIEGMRQEREEQTEVVKERSQQMKQQYGNRIRELEESIKAVEKQKTRIKAQIAQKEKEYTKLVLKNQREVNKLKLQITRKAVELAQERLKIAEMNLEIHRCQSSAVIEEYKYNIKELEDQLAKTTTNDS